MSSRRRFLRNLGGVAALLPVSSFAGFNEAEVEKRILPYSRKYSVNDTIMIGAIGMGIMGFNNVETALKVPGVELVAVADLYKGRLERSKELFGSELFVTDNYEEILNRKDIDAVIISTSDNWHDKIVIEALRKGKAVYCEKPMVHKIEQGLDVIKAQKETGGVLQIGSQRISNIVYAKAKELYKAGEIGQLNCIEASFDRHSALGAWQYTMPPDASENTVAWKRYVRGNKSAAYDPKQFFWWRNYKEFGTGVAGDLFVHLLTGIHFITDAFGPAQIFSTGDISYWKDGRNVPDVMTGVMQYAATDKHPAFQVLLKVNLASGADKNEGGKVRFYGTEGGIDFGGNSVTVRRNKMPKAPGLGGWDALNTYPKAMQEQIRTQYNQKYGEADRKPPELGDISFAAPAGYNEHLDHHMNFFEAVRKKKTVVEDGVFGFRAAAPCLAANDSYFQKKVINWDPVNMKVIDKKV